MHSLEVLPQSLNTPHAMARLSIPTSARLPSTLRVEATNPAVTKTLSRLSRESLISLVLDWLDDRAVSNAFPYLLRSELEEEEEDLDDLYPPCRSIPELQQLYLDMQQQKGSKRDVVSRILDGDWRHGLTLYQLAMVDFSYLDEHPASQKWTAYQILPLKQPSKDAGEEEVLKVDKKCLSIPRFHPSTFLQNLQRQVLPDVKAHYHFYRPKGNPVLLLRIFAIDSPYNSSLALSGADDTSASANFDSSRTVYLAFPDGSPSLYITKSQSIGPISHGELKSLQTLIVDGVPKALSRPRERYTLKSAGISSRNLGALLDKRGPGRGNAAGGGWSIYADEKSKKSPLDTVLPTPPLSRESSHSDPGRKRSAPTSQAEHAVKRRKVAAIARFGNSGLMGDGNGVERVQVMIQDPFPSSRSHEQDDNDDDEAEQGPTRGRAGRRRSGANDDLNQDDDDDDEDRVPSQWTPTISITFHGPHVFCWHTAAR